MYECYLDKRYPAELRINLESPLLMYYIVREIAMPLPINLQFYPYVRILLLVLAVAAARNGVVGEGLHVRRPIEKRYGYSWLLIEPFFMTPRDLTAFVHVVLYTGSETNHEKHATPVSTLLRFILGIVFSNNYDNISVSDPPMTRQ